MPHNLYLEFHCYLLDLFLASFKPRVSGLSFWLEHNFRLIILPTERKIEWNECELEGTVRNKKRMEF